MPIPTKQDSEQSTSRRVGRFLRTSHHKNGTMTTLAAVIKAFLEGVVYCRPTVCT